MRLDPPEPSNEHPTAAVPVAHLVAGMAMRGSRPVELDPDLAAPIVDGKQTPEPPLRHARAALVAALSCDTPSAFFEGLKGSQELSRWFPEVEALIGVDHGTQHHPEGDAWNHAMLCLDRARRADLDCSQVEMLAVLGHDLGKALIPREAWPKMYGHDKLGEAPIRAFCRRLGLDALAEEMVLAARLHHKVHSLRVMRPASVLALIHEVRSTTLGVEGLARVCQADAQGRGGAKAHEPYFEGQLLLRATRAMDGATPANWTGTPDHLRQIQVDAIRTVLAE